MFPTAPRAEVTAKGDIVYSKVVREDFHKLEAYVQEMSSGDAVSGTMNIQKVQDVFKLCTVVKLQLGMNQPRAEGPSERYTKVLSDHSPKALALIIASCARPRDRRSFFRLL
jgi:Fatty acid synthase type I helical domain